jgi:RNA polymerase sigma factor (sigma-70 family)
MALDHPDQLTMALLTGERRTSISGHNGQQCEEGTLGTAELPTLVARCSRGEELAWDELVRRITPLIWTVARSMRLSVADCEDVCQATWLRVLEKIGSIREFDRAHAWIVTVAKREALRHMQKATRLLPVGHDEHWESNDTPTTPEEHAVAGAENEQVLTAFRRLPEHHQALLSLLIADPALTYDEISSQLNIPRGSIGPTRRRILEHMRELMS